MVVQRRTALLLEHQDPVRTPGQDRVRPSIPRQTMPREFWASRREKIW